jgi:hypothetical protein
MTTRLRHKVYAFAAATLAIIVSACGSQSGEKQIVISCDGCLSVELYQTFQGGLVVGEVKPGEVGVAKDNQMSLLEGCMMYEVVVSEQTGWVCDKYLEFK